LAVSAWVGNDEFEIGHWAFLKSFFDTLQYHLSKERPLDKYPKLFIDLYMGHLRYQDAQEVIDNLVEIQAKLKLIDPTKVIWDINDLTKKPPWGSDISKQITSLSNYFVTSKGKDLIETFLFALRLSIQNKCDLIIK
jgi:hypothetical protein